MRCLWCGTWVFDSQDHERPLKTGTIRLLIDHLADVHRVVRV
jgi:hypothetical protein